jgi:hypothetical protein
MSTAEVKHSRSGNACAGNCPLSAVDRRLDDLHEQWHQAEAAYFRPEGFRIAIQTAIQTSRTVTFILQNQKHIIPDFEPWYARWQQSFRDDILMRWMVDARNKIEKQGDLELYSSVRAQLIASYLDEGPRIEVSAKLSDPPWKILKNAPKAELIHLREHGTLRIDRRWVDNSLKDYELLEAVAISYGRISELVRDAHMQMGLSPPAVLDVETGESYDQTLLRGRLPCMIGHEDIRSLNLSLKTFRPIEFREKKLKLKPSYARKVEKRYGIKIEDVIPRHVENYEQVLEALFSSAKTIFLRDGSLTGIYFLLRDRAIVNVLNLEPETHGHKYLMMRRLAHDVTKAGADAVIALTEVWSAPFDAQRPNQRAEDSSLREEQIHAQLVTKTGVPVSLSSTIKRDGKRISLGETQTMHDGIVYSFAPVYEAWGRTIPKSWLTPLETIAVQNQQQADKQS